VKVISLRVSDTLDARLRSIAKRGRVGKSAVIRKALEQVAFEEEVAADSFTAKAQDLAGRLAGAADLSSNKAHLRRYGR
jgi:predicted transcriptional regulator